MHLSLPSLLYCLALILAANYEARARRDNRLTALLSLGLIQLDLPWSIVDRLVSRLNAFHHPRFERDNPLHRAGALLVLAQLSWSCWQLLSAPGDRPQTYLATDLGGVLFNLAVATFIYLSLAALGAGWGLRRDWRGVLQRLGLRGPSRPDWFAGLTIGSLMSVAMLLAMAGLRSLGLDETLGARPLVSLLRDSLPAALLLAMLSATGEEILFRGALQPIFGLVVSSLLFALIHVQYGFSPAIFILFFVGIGFGLVRIRYSTSAAVICHATYNFFPFALYALLPA
jgi:membrane protease YdiL (CAAX protease family)